MDLGVGSFVWVGGVGGGMGMIQSGRGAEGPNGSVKSEEGKLKRRDGKKGGAVRGELWKTGKKAIPLIALGMIRVIMVKGVEYPVSALLFAVVPNALSSSSE